MTESRLVYSGDSRVALLMVASYIESAPDDRTT